MIKADFTKQFDIEYAKLIEEKYKYVVDECASVELDIQNLTFLAHDVICRCGKDLERLNREVEELVDTFEEFE